MKSNTYRRSADRSRVFWQNALFVRLVGSIRLVFTFLFLMLFSLSVHPAGGEAHPPVPILVYHRFGPVVADSMTVTTPVFARHLQYLHENGYTVISLRQWVDWRLGHTPPPPRSVVITVDDAHHSVYSQMLPLVQHYQAPIIMMSQNRQEARDRLRAEHDYRVNLKAELEIRHLVPKNPSSTNRSKKRCMRRSSRSNSRRDRQGVRFQCPLGFSGSSIAPRSDLPPHSSSSHFS